uniref:Uncharacterized protein n=1 Tax=Kalanchoe fedtschenkoi TaxID=63787 RepID=A0A7N0ZX60_KALFE
MEALYPMSHMVNPDWFLADPPKWTKEENKEFERALAIHDKNTTDRWDKIAAMIPGKTVTDVINQYRELEDDVSDIEAGLVPIPGYHGSSFTLDLMDDSLRFNGERKRHTPAAAAAEHEKKKGVPWTEAEHKRFLMGLVKHGKGDWRNISRNFVRTKTPTQVASHAQKYFIRLNSGVKDKRRPSIHDITTGSLADSATASGMDKAQSAAALPREEKNMTHNARAPTNVEDGTVWNKQDMNDKTESSFLMSDLGQRDLFTTLPSTCETDSLHVQGQNVYNVAYGGQYNPLFQIQSSRQRIVG